MYRGSVVSGFVTFLSTFINELANKFLNRSLDFTFYIRFVFTYESLSLVIFSCPIIVNIFVYFKCIVSYFCSRETDFFL